MLLTAFLSALRLILPFVAKGKVSILKYGWNCLYPASFVDANAFKSFPSKQQYNAKVAARYQTGEPEVSLKGKIALMQLY